MMKRYFYLKQLEFFRTQVEVPEMALYSYFIYM